MVNWSKSIHKIRHCFAWYWQLYPAFLTPERTRAQSTQGWQLCCVGHRQTCLCTWVWAVWGATITWGCETWGNTGTIDKRKKSWVLIVTKGVRSNFLVCPGLEALLWFSEGLLGFSWRQNWTAEIQITFSSIARADCTLLLLQSSIHILGFPLDSNLFGKWDGWNSVNKRVFYFILSPSFNVMPQVFNATSKTCHDTPFLILHKFFSVKFSAVSCEWTTATNQFTIRM